MAGIVNAVELSSLPKPRPYSSSLGLRLDTVVPDARFPVALLFLPDGTLLYTEKDTGWVRAVGRDGLLRQQPLIDLNVASLGDSGLLGLTLDPDFAGNGWVYAGFTAGPLPVDSLDRAAFRVVRFTLSGFGKSPGNAAAPEGLAVVEGSLATVAELPASGAPGHEGGNIHFGPDGKLYISLGDRRINNFPNDEALDPHALAGRILRLNADGSIPADNPFGSENPTYAFGLRNAFDFAFDPLTGRLFAEDNGDGDTDELLMIEAGLNYGWPAVSGMADTEDEIGYAEAHPEYREPLLILGRAPTGVAFNMNDYYGAEYVGDVFVGEYVYGTVRRIRLSADRRSVESEEVIADGVTDGINDLDFSPEGIIYLSTSTAILRLIREP